ncbi:MAG: ABC transporter permease [Clostridia bacterium]|nr:ABC transporter permease [Clostridia bacterium]
MLKSIKGTITMLCECFTMSVRNILSNKVRSLLTILGIFIGVTAVIALITTVGGFSSSLTSSFSGMGAGTLTFSITGSDLKSGLDANDLAELTALPEVDGVTPAVSLRTRVSRDGKYETGINVAGKNAYYFSVNPDTVKRGRALNRIDDENRTFVCLINPELVEELFYGVNPIDKTMYIDGVSFTVVGILNDDASESVNDMFNGSPDILIPYTTAMKLNNVSEVTSGTIYLAEGVSSEAATSVLESTLDAMFSYEDDTYTVTSMSSIEDTMESMLGMVSTLLSGIASIALIVGGIGIMNMMLTTVTERTAEIGLKKAIGALPWHIQIQFLTESFLLSVIGGLLGVVFGLMLSMIMCSMMGAAFAINYGAIALGVGFSAAVGLIFGWAPARKASRLNPIDALRSV